MYELHEVTKRYRRNGQEIAALAGLDLSIPDGEFLAIQGQTGSGKSTLLQLLGALDKPSSGSVRYDGTDLSAMDDRGLTRLRAREFGFVFQSYNLIPTMTAEENVRSALVPLGLDSKTRAERARASLEEVGLGHRLRHLPGELSGGEQQRVAIARALVKEPRVILADEPTGNLDEQTRDEIVSRLIELWNAHGSTLIVVTHDGAVASRAYRTARLEAGTVIADGSEQMKVP